MLTRIEKTTEGDCDAEVISLEARLHQKGVDCHKDFSITFENIDEDSFAIYKIHIEGALFCTLYVSDDNKIFVKKPMSSAILLENGESTCIGNQIKFEVFENKVVVSRLDKAFYIKRQDGITETDKTFFENCEKYHGRVSKPVSDDVPTNEIKKMVREKLFFETLKKELEDLGMKYLNIEIRMISTIHKFEIPFRLSYINLIFNHDNEMCTIEMENGNGSIEITEVHKSMILEWIIREVL